MKVVLLKGPSKYNALRCYIDELAKVLAAHGHQPVIIDVQQPEVASNFVQILENQRPADLVFSFGIFAEFVDSAGRTLSEVAGAPHVVQYVDYPLIYVDRLNRVPRTTAILTIDPSHARVIDAFFGPGRFAHVGFNPVAAMGEPVALPQTAEEFLATRPVPVFCAMTYFAPGEPVWREFPEHIRSVFAEAADMALAQEWLPALEAVDRCLVARGLDLADPALRTELQVVRMHALHLNEWVRCVRREQFFAAAAKVGLPLTVYGSGYEPVLERYRNIDYRGVGDTVGTPERMRQARLVINQNSNFGEALHDRVPTGMLAGAAVATDTSTYYRDKYEMGREIALYRWRHLEKDLARIATLVKDGEALFALAKAGQQKALRQDCWEHRLETIFAAGRAAAAARQQP